MKERMVRPGTDGVAKEAAIRSATGMASKELVQLASMRTRWVPSRYNARATSPEGVLVLYNSYSGAVSGFPRRYADRVRELLAQKGFCANELEGLSAYLAERGFLIPETADELQRFRHHFAQTQYKPDVLELILLTSEECNFRCTYCYESFPRGTMEPWVREAAIRLMETRGRSLNRMSVSYFGGEPLLGLEAIEDIAPAALRIAEENDIRYSASITTNGYLLEPDVFEKLIDWNIRSYQITLDGEQESHDRNRPLKEGGGTFHRILDNLRGMKATDHKFSVAMRVNFDPGNVPGMPDFLETIRDFREDRRFKLRFYPVGKWGGPNDADLEVCGRDSEREKQKLDVLASEIGFRTEGRLPYVAPTSRATVCYAARPYNLIIGADGKIMKCTVVLDTKEYNIVGGLSPDGRAEIDVDKLVRWTAPYFEDDETCKKCFYLPVCQGSSCPLPRLELGDRPCPPAKLQIGRTLTAIWAENRERGRKYDVERAGYADQAT